uniref:Uncharacterized protein n=1 Tax=Anguilla anguilla TaxID=7936 RepID=A0A0E9PAF2_ANGAN
MKTALEPHNISSCCYRILWSLFSAS